MAQGCLRGCLYEAMPVNQEMEQAILEHVKLDTNIEDIMKMVLLTKEECKVTESGRRPSSFLFSYTSVLKNSHQFYRVHLVDVGNPRYLQYIRR